MAIPLSINALRAAPKCAALTSPPSCSHSCLPLHVPASHSTLASTTLRSHLPLHTPTNHSTLPPVTPRSHLPLHAPTCLHIKPSVRASPVSSRSHWSPAGTGHAPWLQLDFVDVRHSGERPLGCFPVPAFESLFNRTERSSCECGSGAAE